MFPHEPVVPGDSASQRSAQASGVVPVGVDSAAALFDFLRVMTEAHSAGTLGWSNDQTLALASDALRVFGSEVGRRSAELRVLNGTSASTSPRSSVSGKSALTSSAGVRSRLGRIRSVDSWRPSNVPDGLCYSKMLKTDASASVVATLGKWPTVASLLRTSNSAFQSLADLERFRLSGDSDAAHVLAGGVQGVPLLPVVARVAQGMKTSPGSFGAVLRASAVPFGSSSLRLTARTCLGGDSATRGDVGNDLLLSECCSLLAVKEERFKVGPWKFAAVPSRFVSRVFTVEGATGRSYDVGLAVSDGRFQGFLLPDGTVKIPVGCQRELNSSMKSLLAVDGPARYSSALL